MSKEVGNSFFLVCLKDRIKCLHVLVDWGRTGKPVETVSGIIQGFQGENERFFGLVLEVKLENIGYYEQCIHHKHSNHLLIS